MTTEQNHETPAAGGKNGDCARRGEGGSVMENMRAMAEAFRQERDLYAARLADLQERHDRLRRLCDTLSEGNGLLVGLMRAAYGEVPAPADCAAPAPGDPRAAGQCQSVSVRVHCACCDALLIRREYYAGSEGPFCLLCHGVRLEQQRKEAAGAGRAAGSAGQ